MSNNTFNAKQKFISTFDMIKYAISCYLKALSDGILHLCVHKSIGFALQNPNEKHRYTQLATKSDGTVFITRTTDSKYLRHLILIMAHNGCKNFNFASGNRMPPGSRGERVINK